ncbi:nicotianamine synthase family protein [Paenibacillus sp. CAU 1782]
MEIGQIENLAARDLRNNGNSASSKKIAVLLDAIRETNELLQREEDLTPANKAVGTAIKRLSLLLQSDYSPHEVNAVLRDSYMVDHQALLREKLARAEFELELADSRHFSRSTDFLQQQFERLPYWGIYKSLVAAELAALSPYFDHAGHRAELPIVFVGSGPMPLTSIILHQCCGAEIICLDNDLAAYESSCFLLNQAGLSHSVKVALGKGEEFHYSPFSIIVVASMVRNKSAVLARIRETSRNPIVAIRTAEGMRQIRYEAIDEGALMEQGWEIVARTSPDPNLVINSTLILRRQNTVASVPANEGRLP